MLENDEDIVIFYDKIMAESEKAYKFKIADDEVWMPKSSIRVYTKSKKIYAPLWLLEAKGLV